MQIAGVVLGLLFAVSLAISEKAEGVGLRNTYRTPS
jgi:hypothetical protein